jgi:hypothetical protein
MYRELWHIVAGKLAGRLAVNVLTEAIVEAIFAGGDGGLCECILEPERTQLASKMRHAIPARCSIRPSVSPPMPAPIIRTSMMLNLCWAF